MTAVAGTADSLTEVDEFYAQRDKWQKGWQRFAFPGVWLLYLVQPGVAIGHHVGTRWAVAGWAGLAVFAVCYVFAVPAGWLGQPRRFWTLLTVMVAITVLELPLAKSAALTLFIYLAVLVVSGARRYAIALVAVLTLAATFAPALAPSWNEPVDYSALITIPLIAFAMFGFFQIISGNRALAAARSEVARLAAENERTRIARDLHDLLGHSLTTITVKAGLARRLAEIDPAAAATEIREVEELSRRSLADVRAAVSGYRDVTLAGEIASARAVLRASGIRADLPGAVDTVAPELQDLFGWVVREGVTNVVRHSRASGCRIELTRSSIAIIDDGLGGPTGSGNGLTGLRERVEAAGGELSICSATERAPGTLVGQDGWRLAVRMPAAGGPAAAPTGAHEYRQGTPEVTTPFVQAR